MGASHPCKAGDHLKDPTEITSLPQFPEGTKSMLSKALTKDIWNQLKNKKDKFGFTFKQAIFSGCKWTHSNVGVYAGSRDSYYAFAPFMDKIVEMYHGHKKTSKHVSDLDPKKVAHMVFTPEEAQYIKSTRIRVARNVKGYPLGSNISAAQRKEVEEKVTSVLAKFDGDLKGKYYPLDNMDESVRLQLVADHLLFKSGDKYLQSCGLERDWPKNRGIFYNDAKTFIVWVNEEDELRIISMQQDANIHEVFQRLTRALALIEKEIPFEYDDHLGFTSTCPTNLGTGMRASVHVKIEKLQHKKDLLEQISKAHFVQIRGVHGEHSESADGTYDISNSRRLGIAEPPLLENMFLAVKEMIAKEKEL